MIEMLHCDCKEYMAGLPDKAFDLAIVDPPYGNDISGGRAEKNGWNTGIDWKKATAGWNIAIPKKEYFDELRRVSKNQIIWGGNYFTDFLPASECWVFWDKGQRDFSLADGELAWCSFDKAIRVFEFSRAENNRDKRFHPTQKPIALYKWLLSRYAKPGDKILDTHGGSGSICIACHDLGFDLTWMELDADYYKAACERYNNHAAQGFLFAPAPDLTKHADTPTLFGE